MIGLVLSLLAVAPVEARFGLEIAGFPVAELRISASGDRYVYDSTHFLEEGPRERRIELKLVKGAPLPEVLALLSRPRLGCRDVLEERTRALEQLCVEESRPGEVSGTIANEEFVAHYDRDERLTDITVGSAHWYATPKAVKPTGESPFVRGVSVPAGALRLDPPMPEAKWITRSPAGIGKQDTVGRVRCLVLAREEAARRPRSKVAVGLVIEGGRAYPHAWVTENGDAYDPSMLEGDPLLETRRYLEVPVEKSGGFYLRFFDGSIRLKAK